MQPPESAQNQVTQLLENWRHGDRAALDALLPLVYGELRQIAARYLRQERAGHTLQGTALVHEAYCRLIRQDLPDLQNRAHFYAVAATVMRQILVDHARGRAALKRGGGALTVALDAVDETPLPLAPDVLALDDALVTLARMDPQQGRIVELKFFAGLSNEEAAAALGVSVSTVKRDWVTARAWLYRELQGDAP